MWPWKFPDLLSPDLYLWFLKDNVYKNNPHTLEELKKKKKHWDTHFKNYVYNPVLCLSNIQKIHSLLKVIVIFNICYKYKCNFLMQITFYLHRVILLFDHPVLEVINYVYNELSSIINKVCWGFFLWKVRD